MKKISLTFILIFLKSIVFSQINNHVFDAKFHNSKVLLRWAPISYTNWQNSIKNGYIVQRADLTELTKPEINWLTLNNNILKPENLENLKSKFDANNQSAALAAQMLYGKSSITTEGSLQEIISNSKAEQNNKLGFFLMACSKDFNVAKSVAMGFEDSTIDVKKDYVYRLIAIGYDTSYFVIKIMEENQYKQELPTLNIENKELQTDIQWATENYPFWGYYLEKREKGTNIWNRTTKNPLVQINTLRDSNNKTPKLIHTEFFEKNYIPFEFRLIALDDYGIENIGDIYIAQGIDKTPPPMPDNLKAEGINENSIKLSWTWENPNKMKDVLGFKIEKSISTDFYFETYSDMLNIDTREFTDNKPNRLGNNYYRVVAYDTAGNIAQSVFTYGMVYDDVAPSTPTDLSYTIDSNGIVKLSWTKPQEIDVMGYRIYFANQKDHEFITLTGNPIDTNFFVDTINLKTLTKYAYYKVVALDYNYNHSAYTQPIEVKRPDKIRPQAPFFSNYYTDGTFVRLNWVKSYSDDIDFLIINRRIVGEKNWVEIFRGKNDKDSIFEDKNVKRGEIYEYDVLAVDQSGLYSNSEKKLKVKVTPLQVLPQVDNLKVEQIKTHAQLTWNYSENEGIYFVIYRSVDGKNFEEIDYVENQTSYTDVQVQKGKKYEYKVKPMARKGALGLTSISVSLVIE